jgi:hypothetical protein
MAKRIALSKKIRFEVFKRDKFTCQYCGATAENVVLHVDHIIPVKDGGENELLNLVTACKDCNLGKGATPLSDDSAIAKQRAMLEDLEAKREQIELLKLWRDELSEIDGMTADFIAREFDKELPDGFTLNDQSRAAIKTWLKKFTVEEILAAMEIAFATYAERKAGVVTDESFSKAFDYTPRIAHHKKFNADKEDFWKQVHSCRAILKRRFNMYDKRLDASRSLIARALTRGFAIEDIKRVAEQAPDYYGWEEQMQELVNNA